MPHESCGISACDTSSHELHGLLRLRSLGRGLGLGAGGSSAASWGAKLLSQRLQLLQLAGVQELADLCICTAVKGRARQGVRGSWMLSRRLQLVQLTSVQELADLRICTAAKAREGKGREGGERQVNAARRLQLVHLAGQCFKNRAPARKSLMSNDTDWQNVNVPWHHTRVIWHLAG